MKIIPAIDIIDGKCVRLTKGDYNTMKVYYDNPVEFAKQLVDAGCQDLHVVDLDGARGNGIKNLRTLNDLCETGLKVDFGGGIKSTLDLDAAFDAGATSVSIGSFAIKKPEEFERMMKQFGNRIWLSADVKNDIIAISGWTENTGTNLFDLLKESPYSNIKTIVSTDINVDGTFNGPSIELYKRLLTSFPNKTIIASGGVSSMEDVKDLVPVGVKGVIVGKALLENKITFKELETFNSVQC